jgi:hypothetical protein
MRHGAPGHALNAAAVYTALSPHVLVQLLAPNIGESLTGGHADTVAPGGKTFAGQ